MRCIKNYVYVNDKIGTKLYKGYVIISSKYYEKSLTKDNALFFLNLLEGFSNRTRNLPTYEKVFNFFPCYFVLEEQAITEKIALHAHYSKQMVCGLRKHFTYTCQGYYASGWICHHIINAWTEKGMFDLRRNASSIEANRKPGRIRAYLVTRKEKTDYKYILANPG